MQRDTRSDQTKLDGTRRSHRAAPGSDRRPDERKAAVAAIHDSVGNQGVAQLHEDGDLQPELRVNRPSGPAEQEAERVADQVLSADEAETVTTDRTPSASAGSAVTGPAKDAEHLVRVATNGGVPLPDRTREFFEARFGRDFGNVRVHTDATASRAAEAIDARAFTLGRDIAFARGEYRPESPTGRQLLAHELTHVVQQDGAPRLDRIQRQGPTDAPPRWTSISRVRAYLACNLCRPGPGEVCASSLEDRVLRVLIATGWRPSLKVGKLTTSYARTIVDIDEQVARDDAIQTYLKVEFLVENAEVLKGHHTDKQLSYPGHRPEFNTFYEQLAAEGANMVIGEMLPLSDAAGFALDTGLQLYSNYVADRSLRKSAIRDTIVHRLDDELDENVRALYKEGAKRHYPLKKDREWARRWLMDLPWAVPEPPGQTTTPY